jgi:MraZ protein
LSDCFLGSYTHAIDSQRRIAIPKEWRVTADKRSAVFYLLPGRNRTVQIIPGELFESEVLEKIKKVSFANAEQTRALARIGAKASKSCCDKQGRITLTQELIDHAELKEHAVLIGSISSIQTMTPELWKKSDMGTDEMLDQLEKIQMKGVLE